MNILENFHSAIFNIFANKMRTFLTTLGIVIGITSVIIITAIGKGYEVQSGDILSGIDKDIVNVSTNWNETIRDRDKLTLEDIDVLKGIDNVKYSAPSYEMTASVNLKIPNQSKQIQVVGSTVDTKSIKNVNILYGKFLEEKDITYKNKVAILDDRLAFDIFGRKNVVGETIVLKTDKNDIELNIIGVSQASNEVFITSEIYIPIEVAMEFFASKDNTLDRISLKLNEIDKFSKTEKSIVRTLAAKHGNSPQKYSATGNFQFANYSSGIIKIVTIFIGVVAGISLLVGGIGVMNIMLVTVKERTKEIGIRKSLGATNSNIKVQFLIESISISSFGGILGVLYGYLGCYIIEKVLKAIGNTLVPTVSISVVIFVFVISTLIGVIFGVYPAGKAAKLDPIEALRYE